MSDSTAALHPMAPEHMPYFIPTAEGYDPMFSNVIIFVVVGTFLAGVLYFYLHSIPERMAHGANRTQMQLVAILALIALFTHQNIFWIIALLLAAAQIPDFLTPITSGARSLAALAGRSYEGDDETDHGHPTFHDDPKPDDQSGETRAEA
ncbi:MAG: hypothetical protein AAFR45_06170 [Pseudomonadota bacterium]